MSVLSILLFNIEGTISSLVCQFASLTFLTRRDAQPLEAELTYVGAQH
jgi:hypothetical protein